MPEQRYYFQISCFNFIGCIKAVSFVDAKSKAALAYLPYWNQIEWL